MACLALTVWTGQRALTVRWDRTLFEGFGAAAPGAILPEMVDFSEGWAAAGGAGAMALAAAGHGKLSYRLFLDPGETVELAIRVRNDARVRTRLILQPHAAQSLIELPLSEGTPEEPMVAQTIDLTPHLGRAHYFLLHVDAIRAPEPEVAGPATLAPEVLPVLEKAEFTFRSAPFPRLRAVALVFFLVTLFLSWWAAAAWILPQAAGLVRIVRSAGRMKRSRLGRLSVAALLVALVLLVGAIVVQPLWFGPKPHDDRWALGNARLVALRRFNTADLFFRSRVRPGFLAFILPFEAGLPHATTTVSLTHSDFAERFFYTFDRLDATWGERVHREATLAGLVMALAALGLVARLGLGLSADSGATLRALLTALLGAWFFGRLVKTPMVSCITLSCTWAFELAAMLAFCRAVRSRVRPGPWLAAGILTGLAILFKESALTILIPMGLFQIYLWASARSFVVPPSGGPVRLDNAPETSPPNARARRKLLSLIFLFWTAAAILPLYYYGVVLDGGFSEIVANLSGHVRSQEILRDYEPTSPAGVARALRAVFGWGLVPVAIGLAAQCLRWRRAGSQSILMALWLLGGLTTFALPFVYPRFLVAMIAPVAWFGACGFESVCRVLARVRPPL